MKHKCTTYNIQNSNVTYNSYYEKFADGTVRCIDDEIPFEVPNGWEWCRISSIIELLSGQDFIPEKYNSKNQGIPYITGASNIIKGKLIINRWTQYPSVIGKLGDLLIVCKGSGVGKMCFCNVEKIHIARQIQIIRSISVLTCLHYLKIVIDANLQTIVSNAQGVIPGISREHILNLIIPIPPKEEQIRIAEKVTTITPLIERYEIAQIAKEKLIFIMMNSLKKSILQSAIQGRLVPQDPNDEPASVLIERIRAEKERLIKEKKIKRDKNESVIYKGDDNSYYERIGLQVSNLDCEINYPKSWLIMRLRNVCQLIDGEKKSGSFVCLDAKYLRGKSDASYLNQGRFVCENDNIILVDGENSGEVFKVPCNGYMGSTFKQLWVCSELHLPFLLYVLQYYKDLLRNSKKGAAIPHLNREIFNNLIVGIPPFEEQKRLKSKVDELFENLK